jgi:hypothetical protein
MTLKLKSSVVMNVTIQAAAVLGWIKAKWDEAGLGDFVVTSAKDGQHVAGSQHKQDQPESVPGEAFDIRTRHLWNPQTDKHDPKLIEFARMLQREGFRVIVHRDWMPQMDVPPHLHVGMGKSIFETSD